MPAKEITRMGIAVSPHVQARIQQFSRDTGVAQSKVVSAIFSVLSDAEVQEIVNRYDELLEIEKELRQAADTQFLAYIRGKSVSELRKMLEAVRAAGTVQRS
jgi:hypothetical protein